MTATDFYGAFAVADSSGAEIVRRTCPKHGTYEFHPAVCGRRDVECPKCTVAAARRDSQTQRSPEA